MPALTCPALVAAGLLLIAGAAKLLDPAMTVGALRALRLPASNVVVRVGAAAEMLVGVAAIAVGGLVPWGLVALSYVAFAGFVAAALRNGTMLGSCGCFGREDTPPHWSHLALNVILAGVAVVLAYRGDPAPVDAVRDASAGDLVVLAISGVSLYLVHALYVELPRALVGDRPPR